MSDMITTFWGTGVRKTITSSLALITATATAIVAVPPAWSALGLPEVASKRYVHDEAIDPMKKFTHDLVDPLMQAEAKLEVAQAQNTQTLNQIYLSQLQASLYAAQQDMEKAASHTVQERIDMLQQQIKDLQTKTGGSR